MSESASSEVGARRILFAVHSALTGGAQLMALAAAERLSEHYELHIAVPNGPLRDQFARYGRILRSSPTVPLGWGSSGRWLGQIARSALDALRIAAYVRRHHIDAVYANTTVLLGPVLGARVARVPVIVHARELPPDRRGWFLFAAHAQLAHTVVTVSGAVDRSFTARRRARFVRIYDGIPIPPPPPPRERVFHSPVRLCVIGTVGGDGRKAQDIAIEAVARLAAAGVTAELDLVGPIADGHSEELLRRLARARGVSEHVRMDGPTDQIDAVLDATDIVLSCAREEPLGLTLMEALAHERPVVATRVGGVPEIVKGGETGILVAPEDPDAIAEGVLTLLADPAKAQAMARHGRADVKTRFARSRGLEALEAELARCLER